jgi:hypothetical protein
MIEGKNKMNKLTIPELIQETEKGCNAIIDITPDLMRVVCGDFETLCEKCQIRLETLKQCQTIADVELKQKLYNLNWIQILSNAIKSRPTSWNNEKFGTPVLEWRNASDEINYQVVKALEQLNPAQPESGLLPRTKE